MYGKGYLNSEGRLVVPPLENWSNAIELREEYGGWAPFLVWRNNHN
jgi:hypothetical protein